MPKPQNSQEIARPDSLILLNAITTGVTVCAVLVLANIRFEEGVGYLLVALAPALIGLVVMGLIVAAICDVLLLKHLIKYRKQLPSRKSTLGWIVTILSSATVAFYIFLALRNLAY